MYDIIIKNGLVYDGKRNPAQIRDIGIKGDQIVVFGKISDQETREIIDASGLVVAPGFIDIHGHSDFRILKGRGADSKIRQGVTTEVMGNCGFSAFPVYGECQIHMQELYPQIKIDWNSLAEYSKKIDEKQTALNLVPLIGHGNIRASILGYKDCSVKGADLEKMGDLLRRTLDEGAFGLSTGLIYPPGVYSNLKELDYLASIVAKYKGIYTSHMRSESDRLLEAIKETITIGKESGVSLQISHLKTGGKKNWHKIEEVFLLIEDERNAGRDVTCDRYPYTASATDLDSLLPAWTYEGGNEKELERLKDKQQRKKIEQEILEEREDDPGYWDRVWVSSVTREENYRFEGKSIRKIAEQLGKRPLEALIDLLIEEKLQVSAIFFAMSEENLKKIVRKEYTMIGSDSSIRYPGDHFGKSHPRAFGTFPRAIYLSQKIDISLEDMIYKMTGFPAKKLGLKKRGIIKESAYADIVIFDLECFKDRATYEDPHQSPLGIKYLFVNGKRVLKEDRQERSVFSGRLLKRGEDN
ncbi:amidohydrolase family protein [Candidatus Auribacterota bacterium]